MNRNSKKPQPTRATRGNYRRRMIMFRNTSAIRTVCFVTCATLHEAKAKAAGTPPSAMSPNSRSTRRNITVRRHKQTISQNAALNSLTCTTTSSWDKRFNCSAGKPRCPSLGKDETAVALTVIQPVTQLLQVHQAVTVARADEQIARAKAGLPVFKNQ